MWNSPHSGSTMHSSNDRRVGFLHISNDSIAPWTSCSYDGVLTRPPSGLSSWWNGHTRPISQRMDEGSWHGIEFGYYSYLPSGFGCA